MTASVQVFLRRRADVPSDDAWLTAQELDVLGGLRVAKRRDDWRLGRWAAKAAIRSALDLDPAASVRVTAAEDGAPEAFVGDDRAPLTISLTHRDGRAACAVGPRDLELGCDLELIEPRSDGFVADYFTAGERAAVEARADDRDAIVAMLWSAKESALKALRTGLRADTRSVEAALRPGGLLASDWVPIGVTERPTGREFSGWGTIHDSLVLTVVAAHPIDPPELNPA